MGAAGRSRPHRNRLRRDRRLARFERLHRARGSDEPDRTPRVAGRDRRDLGDRGGDTVRGPNRRRSRTSASVAQGLPGRRDGLPRGVSAVARALKIHTGERRVAVSLIALSFIVMAGQVIGQSAATALFFDRVGTDALPTVYLLQGASCLALMLVMTGTLGRTDQRRAFLAMGAGLAVVVFAERVALLGDATWAYWALWLTVALAVLIQTVFVWGIAGMVTDTRQAKRLFPLFAAGGVLGSVLGGIVTAPLVDLVGAANLLFAWGAPIGAAVVLAGGPPPTATHRGVRRPSRAGPVRDLRSAPRYVLRSRLLVWMTLAAVLFSVLFYSLFLPWAAAAAERYPTADGVAAFIGLFSAVTTGAAFLVSAGVAETAVRGVRGGA